MSRECILALDVSTSVGCCWDNADGRPVFRTIHIPLIGGLGHKMQFIYDALMDLAGEVVPHLIAVEEPLPPRKVQSHPEVDRLLMSLAGVPHMIAARIQVPCIERNVTKIKNYWTGLPKASKPAMIARSRQLGWKVMDDHQADASALWALVHAQRDPKWDLRVAPPPLFVEQS